MDSEDVWAGLADRFVDGHSSSLKGQVRTHVLHQHLLDHLPPPPAAVVDVGGGGGSQSMPLARLGYQVTIADPSRAMLAKAGERLGREPADVRERVRLVQVAAEEAPAALGAARFAGVLCHGVIMYLDEPASLVAALSALAAPGGVVSTVALNAQTLAVGPALDGRWAEALAAFDGASDKQLGVLGLDTRADTVDDLTELFRHHGVQPLAWYGVWLFTDGWSPDPSPDELADVLAVELQASRRDPYRQLSRIFHLVGRKA